MKKNILISCLLLTTTAFAENNNKSVEKTISLETIQQQNHSEKKTFVYLGLNLGLTNTNYNYSWWDDLSLRIESLKQYTPASIEHGGLGGRLKLGINFNQYIGLEGGYLIAPQVKFNRISYFYGLFDAGDESFNQNILDLSLKLSIPFSQKFQLFGQTGIGYVMQSSSGLFIEPGSGLTLIFGGGIGYNINKNWLLDLSYLHYLQQTGMDFPGTDFASVGITYKF